MPNGNRAEQGRKAEPTAPIYVHKHSSYDRSTQVPNVTAQNERLSWAARGLLTYMLSLPADWQLNETDLVGRSPAGRDHLRSILRELEGAGYLHRSRLRDRSGRVVQSIWQVWDLPQTDLPPTENPSLGKTSSSTEVLPQTENPSVAEPQTENPSVATILFTTDSVSARQQTAFPSTENPSIYKETIQQKKHLNQIPPTPLSIATPPPHPPLQGGAAGSDPFRIQQPDQPLTSASPANRQHSTTTTALPPCAEPHRELLTAWWRRRCMNHPTAPRQLDSASITAIEAAAAAGVLEPFLRQAITDAPKTLGFQYRKRIAALSAPGDTTGFDEFRAAYLAVRRRATSQSIPKAITAYASVLANGTTAPQLLAALRANIRAQHEAEAHGGFAACLPDMFRWLRDGLYEAHLPRRGASGIGSGSTPPPHVRRVPDGPVDDPVALCDQLMAARRAAALAS